jgi:hypothetical protein
MKTNSAARKFSLLAMGLTVLAIAAANAISGNWIMSVVCGWSAWQVAGFGDWAERGECGE